MPAKTHLLPVAGLIAGLSVCLMTAGVWAQDSRPAPDSFRLDELVVVGSRDAGSSVTESPVPVDLVTAEEILQTGESELGRVMQTVIPSFNYSSSTVSHGTDAVRPATLRGMGPDQVLVLINGKRRHGSALIHVNSSVGRGNAGTDLNAIPVGAVKRIEVLRDGAAAQYGSDAVAGVINIVLKDDLEGSVQTHWGQTYSGDGDRFTARINKGFQVGQDGLVHVAVEFTDRDRTNRSGREGSVQYPDTETCKLTACTPAQFARTNIDPTMQAALQRNYANGRYQNEPRIILHDPGDKEKHFGRRHLRIGDTTVEQVSGALNFEKPLDALWDGAAVYAFASFSRSENESGGFTRQANQFDRNPWLGGPAAGLFPAGSRYPDGFLPLYQTTIWDYAGGGGLTKEFANGLTADLSVVHGGNDFTFSVRNSHNASWTNRHLGQNRDHWSAAFPHTDFSESADDAANGGSLQLYLTTVNLDFTLPTEHVHLAWGGEYKRDQYEILAGEEYSYADYDGEGGGAVGIQVFSGFRPENAVNETRHAFAFYLDSEFAPTDRLTISPAVRFEHYSDFGNTVNGKAAARWDLTDWFALRGSISSGFRAPSMQQLYYNTLSTQFIVTPTSNGEAIPVEIGTFRNDGTLARAVGIPALDEETSLNLSAGFVFQPLPSLSLTTDFYQIEVDDRIIISDRMAESDAGLPAAAKQALRQAALSRASGELQAQFFMNAVDTRTRGFDSVAIWQVPHIPWGRLTARFVASMSETAVRSVNLPGGLPTSLFSDWSRSIIEDWQPNSHLILSGVYRLKRLTASVALHRYGHYRTQEENGSRQNFSARYLTNLQLGYDLGRFGLLKAGVNNLFDVRPERNRIGQSRPGTLIDGNGKPLVDSQGIFKYSRRSAPFGFNGAFYYFGFEYRI